MIRRALHHGSRALTVVAQAAASVVETIGNFITGAWQHHTDLMQESVPYRQQLALVITAFLGLLRLHPSFAVLAAALGALYVAAYQRRGEPDFEPYREADRRFAEPDRKVGEDLRLRFHDRW